MTRCKPDRDANQISILVLGLPLDHPSLRSSGRSGPYRGCHQKEKRILSFRMQSFSYGPQEVGSNVEQTSGRGNHPVRCLT
jgi:hypothetical protein